MHIAVFLPFLHQGGVERAMLNLARGFVERDVEVDLVLATRADGLYALQIPAGVRVIELRAPKPVASLPGLVKYLRTTHPQALVAALTPANLVAVWACRLARIQTRIIVSVQVALSLAATTTPFRARVRPLVYRAFYPWADAVVAVSRGVAEDLVAFRLPRSKIHIIYNPVVTTELRCKERELIEHSWFRSGEPPVVLGVGRLHPQKDFPTLIKAFALVRQRRPVRLIILGEGEERGRLETLVRELGLGGEVDLPGFVENPYAYMKRAAVFVLSSAWEGFGNVLAEAMAVGTPVVSTNCPSGPAEILEDGRWGRLVTVGDTHSLADAIDDTLKSACDQDALRSRADVFSVDAITSKYMELIHPRRS